MDDSLLEHPTEGVIGSLVAERFGSCPQVSGVRHTRQRLGYHVPQEE